MMFKHLFPLLSAALMLAAAVSCTPGNKIKPETPVKSADWHSVSSSEGTIEVDDVSIEYPSGAFSEGDKIAVSPVKRGSVGGDRECTQFYQLTFPKKGTKQPCNIYFKCEEPDKNKQVVVKMPGWTRHTGESGFIQSVIAGFFSTKNGYMRAVIPPIDPCDTEEPFFTIGILQGYTDADTKAGFSDPHMQTTFDEECELTTKATTYNYAYTWAMEKFSHSAFLRYSSKYSEINAFLGKEIPIAHQQLENLGFRLPEAKIIYKVEEFDESNDAWGLMESSKYITTWGYIRLNAKLLYEFANSRGTDTYETNAGQIRQTLVHETSHAIHEFVYDPRYAPVRNIEGLLGDEWSMLSEAIGCWTEKVTGDKMIGENTPKFGLPFLTHFWPIEKNWSVYREHGYGMGFFIDYIARNLGSKAVVQLYQNQHDESVAGVVDDFRKVILGTKISRILNDTGEYNDFLEEIVTNKRDPRAGIHLYTLSKKWTGSSMTLTDYIYPLGVVMNKINIDKVTVNKNINNSLKITQPSGDFITFGYILDKDGNITTVAVSSDDMPDEVPVETLSQNGANIFLATFRNPVNSIDDDDPIVNVNGAKSTIKLEFVQPDNDVPKLHRVDFDFTVWYGDKTFSDNWCPATSTWSTYYDNKLAVKKNGKGLIINCDNTTSNFQSYVNEKISFYVDSYTGGKVGPVSKIVFDYADSNPEGPVWHMEVESLPVENNTVDPFNENEASWKAKGSKLKVTNLTYKKGDKTYKYKENDSNYVRLSMEYK